MYRQFMSVLCTLAQVCTSTLRAVYIASTPGICIQVCAGTGIGIDLRTGTGRFGKFGTTSIPVPETSVSSVRYRIPGTYVQISIS